MYGMNVDREASGLNSGVLLSFEVQTDEKESGSTEVGKKPRDSDFSKLKKKSGSRKGSVNSVKWC